MFNYLLPRLENILEILSKDFLLIAKKKKDDEWKRDHYRYAFTIAAQRMYSLLDEQLTGSSIAPAKESTRKELVVLRDQINKIIEM